jgi:probable HAF family extracellular repeat protein
LGTQINSINAKGEIVGVYVDAEGNTHGFLGTPTP